VLNPASVDTIQYWLVMPAAGVGTRFGVGMPKQYQSLQGRALGAWALAPFLDDSRCRGACVSLAAGDDSGPTLLNPGMSPKLAFCTGGRERADSVLAALESLPAAAADEDWVLVHDAARPCVSAAEIDALLASLAGLAAGGGGALLALPLADTLKRELGVAAVETVGRERLWRAPTPQAFRLGALRAVRGGSGPQPDGRSSGHGVARRIRPAGRRRVDEHQGHEAGGSGPGGLDPASAFALRCFPWTFAWAVESTYTPSDPVRL
jgi:2-C-methyl-D-erythritol 4-phosphate cytidylyltransferase